MSYAINNCSISGWEGDGVRIPEVPMLHDARTINTAEVRSIESHQSQLKSNRVSFYKMSPKVAIAGVSLSFSSMSIMYADVFEHRQVETSAQPFWQHFSTLGSRSRS